MYIIIKEALVMKQNIANILEVLCVCPVLSSKITYSLSFVIFFFAFFNNFTLYVSSINCILIVFYLFSNSQTNRIILSVFFKTRFFSSTVCLQDSPILTHVVVVLIFISVKCTTNFICHITSYHKCGGLNHHTFIISHFPQGQESRCD